MTGEYNILIVDDNPSNLDLLKQYVLRFGYKPATANGGREALRILAEKKIDAVLLDIMMPDVNGREVLESIKKDPETSHIPVIMVSALDGADEIASFLEAGADDYVSKPFNSEILHARLGNCLERKALYDKESVYKSDIEKYNSLLAAKVEEKTRELRDAYEKLKILDEAKDDFIKFIAHELRTPLTGLEASAELLFESAGNGNEELINIYRTSFERINKLVEQAVLISELNLSRGLSIQVDSMKNILMSGIADASVFFASNVPEIVLSENITGACRCDPVLMVSAFREIFKLCARFCGGPGIVRVSSPLSGTVEISVARTDSLFTEEEFKNFSDLFTEKFPVSCSAADTGTLIAFKILKVFSGAISPYFSGGAIVLVIKVPAF